MVIVNRILTERGVRVWITVNDPSSIAIVGVAPRTTRITVSKHNQTIRNDTLFLEIVKEAIKVSTATAGKFIIINSVKIFASIITRVINTSIKASNVDLETIEDFHHTSNFADKLHTLLVADRTAHVNHDRNVNFFAGVHTGHDSIHVPTTTRRTHPCVVALDCASQVDLNKLTPGHDRFSHFLNETLNACRNRTGFCLLSSIQNSLTHFLTDFFTLSVGQLGTTLTATTLTILLVITVLVITVTIKVIVKHLVQKLVNTDILDVLHEVIIDSLSGPALILTIIETFNSGNEFTNLVLLKVGIYCIVISNIPHLRITLVATTKVIINHVQHFVTYKEFDFLLAKLHDETTIVIEVATVSSSSTAPFVCIDKLKASSKVAKESVLEQKPNTSHNKTLTGFVINLRISRAHKAFKLVATRTLTLRSSISDARH